MLRSQLGSVLNKNHAFFYRSLLIVGIKLNQDKLGLKRMLELAQLPLPLSFLPVLPMMVIIPLNLGLSMYLVLERIGKRME